MNYYNEKKEQWLAVTADKESSTALFHLTIGLGFITLMIVSEFLARTFGAIV